MRNVGHGLNVFINTNLMLDCGSRNLSAFLYNFTKSTFLPNVKVFVLSHLHGDHYNGIFSVPALPKLDKFYIPGIPNISSDPDIIIDFYALLLSIGSVLSKKIVLVDLLQELKIKSGDKNIPCQLLYNNLKGVNLSPGSSSLFDIIWPPKNLDPNSALVKRIKKVLNIVKTLNLHKKIEGLNDLIGTFRRILQDLINNGNLSHDYHIGWDNFFAKLIISDIHTIEKLNGILINLADDLSLSFIMYEDKHRELLFLGDLTTPRVKNALDAIPITPGTIFNTDMLLPPHHGTRWHNDMNNIFTSHCLSSLDKNDFISYYKDKLLSTITSSGSLWDTNSHKNITVTSSTSVTPYAP